jgi:hypothetical protein
MTSYGVGPDHTEHRCPPRVADVNPRGGDSPHRGPREGRSRVAAGTPAVTRDFYCAGFWEITDDPPVTDGARVRNWGSALRRDTSQVLQAPPPNVVSAGWMQSRSSWKIAWSDP